ncbi:MAG: AEC family transporter [Lachnospiraceae bacterium]|nr:AEC family transporter [Lachnospiraceae bacterium]
MDISIIINQMLILFIIMGVGYLLNKTHILGRHIDGYLTKFIIHCTMPAMVLASVLGKEGGADKTKVLEFLLISVVMYLLLPLLAAAIIHILPFKSNKGLYQFMIIFGNVGFMGFPLINALFGETAILYAGVFNMIFNFMAYSYGIIIVANDNKESNKDVKLSAKLILSPGILAAVLALVIYFAGLKFPDVINSPVSMIGNITSPLAMLIIGSTLANMDLKDVFTDLKVYSFCILRGLVLPAIYMGLIMLFIKDEYLAEFTFIMALMPVANTSVLYAKEYNSDESLAAKCVFISTVLSIITIPLWAFIFQSVAL